MAVEWAELRVANQLTLLLHSTHVVEDVAYRATRMPAP
jgi:hypothetical protein